MNPILTRGNYVCGDSLALDIPKQTLHNWKKKKPAQGEVSVVKPNTVQPVPLDVGAISQNRSSADEPDDAMGVFQWTDDDSDTSVHLETPREVDLFCPDSEEDGTLEDGTSAPTTLEEAHLYVVLHMWKKFRTTKQRLGLDLLHIHTMLGTGTRFPKSIYTLKKLYEEAISLKHEVRYLYPKHGTYVAVRTMKEKTNVAFSCNIANEQHELNLADLHQSCLLTVSVESQLSELFSVVGDKIEAGVALRNRSRARPTGATIHEFVEGGFYRRHKDIGPYNVTLIAHTGTAEVTKSSNVKSYTVHWTVAELPVHLRGPLGVLHTAWIGRGNQVPDRKTLLLPFLEELYNLSTNKTSRIVEGREVRYRVFCVCIIADVMERGPLAGIYSIGSFCGCTFCKVRTMTTWSDPENRRSHRQTYPAQASVEASARTDEEMCRLDEKLHRMAMAPAAREIARKDSSSTGCVNCLSCRL